MRLSAIRLATLVLAIAALLLWTLPASAQVPADGGTTTTTTSTTDLSPQRAFDILASNSTLGVPALTVSTDEDGMQNYSVIIQSLLLMTSIKLLPTM